MFFHVDKSVGENKFYPYALISRHYLWKNKTHLPSSTPHQPFYYCKINVLMNRAFINVHTAFSKDLSPILIQLFPTFSEYIHTPKPHTHAHLHILAHKPIHTHFFIKLINSPTVHHLPTACVLEGLTSSVTRSD